MGCGGGSAPAPDPNIGIAQRQLSELALKQNDFYQQYIAPRALDQMDQALVLSKQQADKQNQLQDFQTGLMKEYNDRYWNTQVPLEDQLISQAKNYNTDAERERMAGEAGADVQQSFENSNSQLGRGLRGMGVNMGSAAAVMAMQQAQSDRALAQTAAMNKTRQAAKALGWTQLGEAAALGRGLPSFGSTSAGLSLGAGQSAIGAGQSGMGAIGSVAGMGAQNTGAVGGVWGQVGNLGVQKYNAQISAYNAEQANSPLNTLMGVAAGAGTSWLMAPAPVPPKG
jgi:hypothetical protein